MTSAAPIPAPERLASRLFASGALAFFLLGLLPALFGVALPGWSKAFGLAEGQGGALLATYNAGAGLTVLASILGVPGLTMRPAFVAVALGGAILALGATWGALLAGGFVLGLGYGILAARVNRRFLQEFGPRGPGMVSLVNGIYGLGSILAPLLFLAAGSRSAPILWAAAALALLAMALGRPEPFRVAATGLPPVTPRLLVLLLNFAGVSVEVGLIALGAAALVDTGFTEPGAARLVSAFFAAFVAARLGLAALSHRVPPDIGFLVGMGGTAAACGLAAMGAPAPGFVLAGGFVGLCFPSVFVWSSRLLGPDPRMGAAILAAGSAGGTLGPLALRPILGAVGEEGLFWIVSVVGALLTVVVALLRPRLRRLPPPGTSTP